jgi:hypothetical protein
LVDKEVMEEDIEEDMYIEEELREDCFQQI